MGQAAATGYDVASGTGPAGGAGLYATYDGAGAGMARRGESARGGYGDVPHIDEMGAYRIRGDGYSERFRDDVIGRGDRILDDLLRKLAHPKYHFSMTGVEDLFHEHRQGSLMPLIHYLGNVLRGAPLELAHMFSAEELFTGSMGDITAKLESSKDRSVRRKAVEVARHIESMRRMYEILDNMPKSRKALKVINKLLQRVGRGVDL